MLSQEIKDALAEHYRGKDLYEPDKDHKQDPEGYCKGGVAMAHGGMVAETDFESMKDLLKKPPTHEGMVKNVEYLADGGAVMEQGPEEALIQGPLSQGYEGGSMVDPGDMTLQHRAAQQFKSADLAHQPSMRQGPITSIAQDKTAPPPLFLTADEMGTKPLPVAQDYAHLTADQFHPQTFQPEAPQVAMRDAIASDSGPKMTAPLAKPTINPADLGYYAKAMQQDQPSVSAPAAPAQASSKLAPDEMSQLIAALSQKPSAGQNAMAGLAGLADAISTGVARSENPGFQKNILAQRNQRNQDLINALKAKYELGYKGQELAEAQRSHKAEESQREKALSEETRQHNLEAGQRGATLQFEQGKESREAAQRQRDIDLKTVEENKYAIPFTDRAKLRDEAEARLNATQNASGPYGAQVTRGGKVYVWSPVSGKYHLK